MAYELLKWPVNPPVGGSWLFILLPFSLLSAYWLLHWINLGLAGIALCFVCRSRSYSSQNPVDELRCPDRPRRSPSLFIAWILLALLIFIPGVYLEYPADTWGHFARISDWSRLAAISDHAKWQRSCFYFFAYSLLGRMPAEPQRLALDVFYTGWSLLLCWQYFKLGVETGLSRGSAMFFVVLQAILPGNNVFSFFRYYGIASTIVAQIGSIALIRMGLHVALSIGRDEPREGNGGGARSALRICLPAASLLLLIVFSHVQGVGIASLGISAVATWRFLKWKPAYLWRLGLAVLILSLVAVRWFPRNPAIDSYFRPWGVFSAWYGFNVFSIGSGAGDRTMQVLGFLGVINFVAGIYLVLRNRVAGWLTIMPVLALCLPFVAIPFAGALAVAGGPNNYIVFQRMLFAVPAGLAAVTVASEFFSKAPRPLEIHQAKSSDPNPSMSGSAPSFAPFALGILLLLALTAIPVTSPYYNHFWNALARSPDDLTMRAVCADFDTYLRSRADRRGSQFAALSWLSNPLESQSAAKMLRNDRMYYNGASLNSDVDAIRATLNDRKAGSDIVLLVPRPTRFYTAYSFAAICSDHWLPQEAALAYSAGRELRELASSNGVSSTRTQADSLEYYEYHR